MMGRYLARALAAMEAVPAAKQVPPPVALAAGFGGYGGFGERAENENQPPEPSPWPEGADYFLTRDATRISGLISTGCDWRWCPDGGLEIVKENGLLWAMSPTYSRRLEAARLLPAAVLEAAP